MNKTKTLATLVAIAVTMMSSLHLAAQPSPERVTVTKQVGTYSRCLNMSPLNTNVFQSMSETVYTAQELGLVPGAVIKSIAYEGYSSVSGTAPVQAWIANTTDAVPTAMTAAAAADVSLMTSIHDGDYEFEQGGTATARVEMMRFDLSTPFEYTGGNLRLVVKSVVETKVGLVYFAVSGTMGSFYRTVNNTTGDLTTANYYRTYKPIINVTYEKDMSYFTGTLRLNRVGGAVETPAGATITLTGEDETVYQTVTDAEGNYRVAVPADEQTYAITVEVPGVTIFPVTDKAAFAGLTLVQDITVTEAADFYIDETDAPGTATVNNRYTASLKATNYNATTMPAGDYTVALFVDGEQVAQAETADVASMAQGEYTMTFTPHEAGTFAAYMQVSGPKQTMKTPEFTIEVSPEFASGDVQVLNQLAKSTSPINTYYSHSMSETVYTADKIGLDAGARIQSLSYLSYKTTDAFDAHIQIWIENTADGIDFTAGRDVNQMRKIYDEVINIDKHGSANELLPYIVADMSANPFEYTGGNIRVVVQCDAADAKSMSFWVDNTYKGTINKQSNTVEDAQEIAWGTSKANSPVIVLAVINSVELTGKTVTTGGDIVAGATVTIVNEENDVIYTATSDDNGEFAITVVRHDLPYVVTAEKDKLQSEAQQLTFDGNDVNLEIVLKDTSTAITTVSNDRNMPAGIYTLDGRRLSDNAQLPAGIYIINGKKVIKR